MLHPDPYQNEYGSRNAGGIIWPCTTCRDADETVSWIAEKDAVLSSDDFGKDLASVQTLQRKHEGIERDLAALEVRKLES